MTQPFADALSWVPKSRSLSATLGRAHDLARAQGQAEVSLEHALQALIEDPDASSLLLSCNIDLLSLNAAVSGYTQQLPANGTEMPEAAQSLLTILEYAVAAARQSKRPEINGAIVLAAIIGEGKSEAARLLLAAGMKFEDAVMALRRASVPRAAGPADGGAAVAAQQPKQSQSEAVPAQTANAAEGRPPPPSPVQVRPAPPSVPVVDDDPVTTARRRIAAIRSGQDPSTVEPVPRPAAPAPIVAPVVTSEQPPPAAFAPAVAESQKLSIPAMDGATALAIDTRPAEWAPPPMPQPAPANRPVRMPPPVPPISQPIPRPDTGYTTAPAAHVPWAAPASTEAALEVLPAPSAVTAGPPIQPEELAGRIPERMRSGVPMTVEMRIPRSAVLGTALGAGATRDTSITRALSVRLRAPSGGFHVENASPETQWFDTKGAQRGEDEIRWRWLVTPHGPGKLPLQLSIGLRTVAADGMIVETALPEQQVRVHISRNLRSDMRGWMAFLIAISSGVALTLLATGGFAGLLGR